MQGIFESKKRELKSLLKEKINDELDDLIEKITDYNMLLKIIVFVENTKSVKKEKYKDIIEFFLSGQSRPTTK